MLSKPCSLRYPRRQLAERFAGSALTADCIRVTNVKVDLGRYSTSRAPPLCYAVKSRFSISPEATARTYLPLCSSEELNGVTGTCFDEKNRIAETSPYPRDRRRTREHSERTEGYLTGN